MEEKFNLLDTLEKEFEDSVTSGVERVGQKGLASVSETAKQIRLAAQAIEAAQIDLKEKEAEHRRLTDEVMPALFAELGMSEFTLDDGSKITVKQTYSASPLKENREKVTIGCERIVMAT